MLMPDEAGDGLRAPTNTTRTAADMTFTLDAVPPGRYLAVARAGGRGPDASPLMATQRVAVSGADIDGLVLTLTPGGTVSGSVSFDGAGKPDSVEIRIEMTPLDQAFGGIAVGRAGADGRFTVTGVSPGRHVLRVPSPPRGWTVKSAMFEGRDLSEEIVEVKGGQTISGVEVLLTDHSAAIAGAVLDEMKKPSAGSTVILFPADTSRWGPQSRRIRTAQTDQDGRYNVEGVPDGDYLIAAVEDAEQGEWYDPAFLDSIAPAAVRVEVTDGARATQDLRLMRVP
jgi:hypothetical protein